MRVLDLSADLKTLNYDTQISGKIVETKPDGTVRIETDAGEVVARLPERVVAVVGQRVDLTLPRGDPPRDATIAAARNQIQTPAQTPSSSTPEPEYDPAATVPRVPNAPAPVDKNLRDMATARAQQTGQTPPATPEIGQVVQIKPITAAQARQIVQQVQNVLSQTLMQTQSPDSDALTLPTLTTISKGTITTPGPATMAGAGGAIPPSSSALTTLFLFQPPGVSPSLPMMPGLSIGPAILPQTGAPMPMTFALPDGTLPDGLISNLPMASAMTNGTLQARVMAIQTTPFLLALPTENAGQSPLAQSATPLPTASTPEMPTLRNFTVLGATDQGHVILQGLNAVGAIGATVRPEYFVLQAPSNGLPPGSTVVLQPLTNTIPTTRTAGTLAPLAPQLMDDLAALMEALPPTLAREIFGGPGRIPTPNVQIPQQLGATAMLFLAALRSGDVQGWLGERAVDALRRAGKGGVIDKLEGTFDTLRSAINDRSSGDWRSYLLPFQFQHEVKPITLHVKPDAGDDKAKDQGQGQRFIVEVDLNRMGAVQLDLLYRPKILDTILRTELPLSRPMAEVLAEKYARAMGNTGLSGQLFFQHGLKNWVMIDESREGFKVLA